MVFGEKCDVVCIVEDINRFWRGRLFRDEEIEKHGRKD